MKWNLTNYYKTYEDFKVELENAKKLVSTLGEYKGKLNDKEKFNEYFSNQLIILERYEKLYLYAECSIDLDRKNTKALSDMQEVMFMFQQMGIETSFENSEILSLDEKYVYNCLNEYPNLKQFKYSFENLFRQKEHTPSAKEQRIIANYEALANNASETYSSLCDGDVKEHNITLDNNEVVNVCDANWTKLIGDSKSIDERKRIFDAEFSRFDEHKNTLASIYNSVLQADIAKAKSLGFDSSLEMYLYRNNIPTSLYHNLIEIAHKAAPFVKEYIDLRRKTLGLDEYHTYDRFLDLVESENERNYTYEEAKNLFFDSIEKYPIEFKEFAKEALKDGYVDVYPSVGKRSGAYSNSTPKTHPCILLNFTGNLDSCFTLAHEAGHSIHSLFSSKYQPVATESYTIFVAEIASTFNEHNLLDYLLTKGALSKNEKIKLTQNALDDIMGTFIRQTLFAEYEFIAHDKAEKGEPITEETLSNIMIDLYKEYYGLDINKEVYKKYVWAYIHHFFPSPFYVYQYATSFSASLAIYQKVKNNEPNAFTNYLELLKSGGSDYPINLVKKAGVDFTKIDALESVVKRFEDLLNELKGALND